MLYEIHEFNRALLAPITYFARVSACMFSTPGSWLAQLPGASRIAAGYESRAQAMANDLVDGITPEVVRAFRAALLKQAARPDLAAELAARYPKVYGKVLPGFGTPSPDTVHYVIGPAKQLDAYQEYLRATVDKIKERLRKK